MTTQAPMAPLAVGVDEAARLLGVSRRHFYVLKSEGKLPPAVNLGRRSPRWLVSDLRQWLEMDVPRGDVFRKLRHRDRQAVAG